jgi:cellulose synthase/poly-beta-1,6-N-acetylglucosamine synthase-like glycosyltransferase
MRPSVALLSVDLDNPEILSAQSRLFQTLRETEAYRLFYRVTLPLVTVCITTADRADVLRERALASMLRQSYRNIEVIIVGDCCEDNTEQVIAALNDSRFTFVNLPERGPYPAPAVGGCAAM